MDTHTPKAYFDGTHRCERPQNTFDNVRGYLLEFGITRIANITGLDRIGIPVFVVCRPNSRSIAISQGKGATDEAALVSGVMESIETYHAERIGQTTVVSKFAELRDKGRVANIERLPKKEDSVFDENKQIQWISGTDLYRNQDVWVPYELVHTNYTRPRAFGDGSFLPSSNGLASGNNLPEAISHAITEVVERDSYSLWSVSEEYLRSERRLDLQTVSDPWLKEMLHKYEQADIEVAIWDVTSDTGIPAYICWNMEKRDGLHLSARCFVGSGCHPTKEVALSRALTEAAQDRLTVISGARDDLDPAEYESLPGEIQRAREHIFHRIQPEADFEATQGYESETVEEDIDWELRQLASVGVDEVIVIDLTKPEYDIPVVKVIIPGLEAPSDDPGYTPGVRAQNWASQQSWKES